MTERWFPYTYLRREQNCSRFTAFVLASLQALGWIFLRLESPSWKALRAQHRRLYPHLADKSASIGDPLRYAIQSLWLLLVRPAEQNRGRRSPGKYVRSLLQALLRIVQQPWNLLSNAFVRLPTAISPQVIKSTRRWNTMGWPLRKALYIAIGVLAAVLIIICVTEPFGYLAQLVFVILLWGIAIPSPKPVVV